MQCAAVKLRGKGRKTDAKLERWGMGGVRFGCSDSSWLSCSVQFSSVSLPAGGVTRVQSVECGSCGQQGVTASAGEMHGAGVCVRVCMCVYDWVCVCGEPWCRRVRGGGGGVGGSLWEAEASVFFLEDLHGILAGLHLQQRPRSCCLCFARGEVATFSPWETRETQQGGRKRRKRQSAEWVTV